MKKELIKLFLLIGLIGLSASCKTLPIREEKEEIVVEHYWINEQVEFDAWCVDDNTFSILLKEAGRD